MNHGTERCYRNGCRCDLCRTKWNALCQERRARRLAKGVPLEVHGTYNGAVNYSCKCDLCREARANYDRIRRWTKADG